MNNSFIKYFKILSVILFLVFSASFTTAHADTPPSVNDILDAAGSRTDLQSMDGDVNTNYPLIIGRFIETFLSLLGVIFVGLMIYAGFLWFMARGDEQMVTKAKDIIEHAIVGLIIVSLSYAITVFLISSFGSTFTSKTGY